MKIRFHSPLRANVLLMVMFTMAAVGLVLMSYLQLGSTHEYTTARSQAWNLAMPLAEAGLEEALTQLNEVRGKNDLECNGWVKKDGAYKRTRELNSNAYYTASIKLMGSSWKPVAITSTGYVRDPRSTNFIGRTIFAGATTTNVVFTKAIIARKHVRLGKGTLVDSFDSSNPSYSGTNGSYVASKRKDNASIATTSNKKNGIKIDKTKVYGNADTAAKGGVEFKNNGTLGDKAWIDSGNTKGQPGKIGDDFTYDYPVIKEPWNAGTGKAPKGATISGTNYQYALGKGNYELGSVNLKQPMKVTGNAVLYVTGDFKAEADIIIDKNASLTLFMGGHKFEVKDKSITINSGVAAQFQYYGLPKNKSVKLTKKGADFAGVVYAPNAKIKIDGDNDVMGSVVGKCVHVKHNGEFHYDEGINSWDTEVDLFKLTDWREN